MCGVLKPTFHSVMMGCPFDGRSSFQLSDNHVVNERHGGGCMSLIFKTDSSERSIMGA
jgi:hypothetical protein